MSSQRTGGNLRPPDVRSCPRCLGLWRHPARCSDLGQFTRRFSKDRSPSIIQYAKLCVGFVRPVPGNIECNLRIRHAGLRSGSRHSRSFAHRRSDRIEDGVGTKATRASGTSIAFANVRRVLPNAVSAETSNQIAQPPCRRLVRLPTLVTWRRLGDDEVRPCMHHHRAREERPSPTTKTEASSCILPFAC